MLNWCSRFSIHLFLDSNGYTSAYSRYQCIVATGVVDSIANTALDTLQSLHNKHHDWLFGHLAYDYKNTLFPRLHTAHPKADDFPAMHFFVPETVCFIDNDNTTFTIASVHDPADIYQQILSAEYHIAQPLPHLSFTSQFSKNDYIETVEILKRHIEEGDCYEINFCNKGHALDAVLDPTSAFTALNTLSPAPFAAYYRYNEQYMMCASPERYLYKQGERVMSQPIKGTARRGSKPEEDTTIKEQLYNDIKERAENVMIVDLVRNDLARSCKVGSITVDELFGIYTYPQVHQMISTVSGTIKDELSFTDTIRHSFPMGSMTGAPKYKVMQLIDEYEQAGRGLFSGSLGYISPNGDFDLNVIIRSLFYNSSTHYLHYHTGGAITYDSIPEKEWDEMRLKAWAMERIFATPT